MKRKLTTEEKLKIAKELAGSAKNMSAEGIEELIKIANREYDEEDEE